MLKTIGMLTLISTMTILGAVVLGGWVAGGEPETTKDIGARVPGDV